MWDKVKRRRMILYDKNTMKEQDGVDEEIFDRSFKKIKDSLHSGDTFFKIEDSTESMPETREGISTVMVTEEDRGYLFMQRDSNEEYVDYAMMRVDYDLEEDRLEAGVTKLLQFEYDELADPTGTPISKNQFYFDLLQEAGDRAPEELVSRLSKEFTPDYDIPETSEWRYDD